MSDRWELTILGIPRTKKNSRQANRRGYVVLPSKAWMRWVRTCVVEVVDVPADWPARYRRLGWLHRPILGALIEESRVPGKLRVNCCAQIYRDADRGDANGYYQGIADLLEELAVISNDRIIVSWNGSQLLKDPARPRVELVLEAAA